MITPKEATLTYKESIIRIVNQVQTVVITWESKLDGSVGHLQVARNYWDDGFYHQTGDGNHRPLLQQISAHEAAKP